MFLCWVNVGQSVHIATVYTLKLWHSRHLRETMEDLEKKESYESKLWETWGADVRLLHNEASLGICAWFRASRKGSHPVQVQIQDNDKNRGHRSKTMAVKAQQYSHDIIKGQIMAERLTQRHREKLSRRFASHWKTIRHRPVKLDC